MSSVSNVVTDDCYEKLHVLNDVRQKTIQLENLKLLISNNLSEAEQEESCLSEYQNELEILLQEKMAHVEELRLIHTDVNTIENLIKQTKLAHKDILVDARSLYSSYLPLIKEINDLRASIGIESLKDDMQNLPSNTYDEKQRVESVSNLTIQPDERLTNKSIPYSAPTTAAPKIQVEPSSKIYQQTPPMKSCQSCHQLIHRNAPICPLCKAKSRSRNAKKSKKKM